MIGEEEDIRAEDHEPSMYGQYVLQEVSRVWAPGLNARDLSPEGGDHPLRQVANVQATGSRQVYSNLFRSLADRRSLIVCIFSVPLASRQSHMACPPVSFPCRSLYEQHLWIA